MKRSFSLIICGVFCLGLVVSGCTENVLQREKPIHSQEGGAEQTPKPPVPSHNNGNTAGSLEEGDERLADLAKQLGYDLIIEDGLDGEVMRFGTIDITDGDLFREIVDVAGADITAYFTCFLNESYEETSRNITVKFGAKTPEEFMVTARKLFFINPIRVYDVVSLVSSEGNHYWQIMILFDEGDGSYCSAFYDFSSEKGEAEEIYKADDFFSQLDIAAKTKKEIERIIEEYQYR